MGFALGLEPSGGVDGLKRHEHHGPGQRKHTDSRRWNGRFPHPEELSLVDEVRETYRKMFKVGCTGCAYCMPCEAGVVIPALFSFYNDSFVFPHRAEMVAIIYNNFFKPEQRASACIECAKCEEKCPQHIPIREELKNVHQRLSRE